MDIQWFWFTFPNQNVYSKMLNQNSRNAYHLSAIVNLKFLIFLLYELKNDKYCLTFEKQDVTLATN